MWLVLPRRVANGRWRHPTMEAKRPRTVDDLMAWPDEHVEIDRRSAEVAGVAGGPGAEQVGQVDARYRSECFGDHLPGPEGPQEQFGQRLGQRAGGRGDQASVAKPAGGDHAGLLGAGDFTLRGGHRGPDAFGELGQGPFVIRVEQDESEKIRLEPGA